jgi:hypothetical protein
MGLIKSALGEHFFCQALVRTAMLGIGVEHETVAGPTVSASPSKYRCRITRP